MRKATITPPIDSTRAVRPSWGSWLIVFALVAAILSLLPDLPPYNGLTLVAVVLLVLGLIVRAHEGIDR